MQKFPLEIELFLLLIRIIAIFNSLETAKESTLPTILTDEKKNVFLTDLIAGGQPGQHVPTTRMIPIVPDGIIRLEKKLS